VPVYSGLPWKGSTAVVQYVGTAVWRGPAGKTIGGSGGFSMTSSTGLLKQRLGVIASWLSTSQMAVPFLKQGVLGDAQQNG